MNIKIKINSFEDRRNVIMALVDTGYTVGIEKKKSTYDDYDFYVVVGVTFEKDN